ncbi:MAG: GAF domain-containing protein, partial [Anaerolineaceae bacterium]|nr:GAF domain-containing protein [Anaerolineaceae bacterium]
AMAASLDLYKTLQAILENVEKILPADFLEITIWDAEGEVFIPYRFSGFPGLERKLSLVEERYKANQGLSAIVFQQRKPLLVPDIEARVDLKPALAILDTPIRSFIGVPLIISNETIGVLSLGSMSPDTFGDDDLDLVNLLSGQAAIALHNALLYRAEKQRTAELSGLAQLAQAFSSVRNPAAVFGRLVESIVPLLPVDILGFLVYNESHRILEAQTPFHGLPDQIVQLYNTQVPSGSPAEQILLDQDLLITENASEDEKWVRLGLEYIAQAASLRETVLVPLSAGGHMLGYLQASNHSGASTPFTQAELHLLMIVANQTASIIENTTLVHQSRQRALRAEALRRITSLASSAATLEEILKFSLQELARLLNADIGAVFLLNQEHSELKLHQSSVFGTVQQMPDRLAQMVVDDAQFHFTVAGSQHILSIDNFSESERAIVPFYQAVLNYWMIESLIVVPLVIRDEGIGEVWFGSLQNSTFDQGDVQVVATAAGQLAGVVEQSFLRSQTDESLRRRVDQMVAINRISRELSTSLDLNYLLNLVYDEALRTISADCGTILLFDLDGSRSSLSSVRFFVGDEPAAPLSALERLVVESGTPIS